MAKDTVLRARMDSTQYEEFTTKCSSLGKTPASMTREMVQALNEGRLNITQSERDKQATENQKEIYT